MAEPTDELESAPDGWERRQLCPDGACVGIIRDGRCTECGALGPGEELDPRQRGLRNEAEVALQTEKDVVAHSTPVAPDDWEDRELCSDGSCIGVIGSDGVCTECGQAPEETPQTPAP